MDFTKNSVPYLKELSSYAKSESRLTQVQAALQKGDAWTASEEWRISTVTKMTIERVSREDSVWYRVQVQCDVEMICYTPTIERAVEFVGIFEKLTRDLFWTLGWPSAPR